MCRRSSWRIVNVVIDVDVVGDDDKEQNVSNKLLVVVHHFNIYPMFITSILSIMTTTSTLTTVKVTRSVLEEQLENCKQLLDLEPDSKWPLLTQVILADQGDFCPPR